VLPFPIAVWRIDVVLLILLGLFLLPVSFGLWEIRKSEGLFLIFIYAAYLVGTTLLGRRWG
jgi:Ca2+/Na+ antiporter